MGDHHQDTQKPEGLVLQQSQFKKLIIRVIAQQLPETDSHLEQAGRAMPGWALLRCQANLQTQQGLRVDLLYAYEAMVIYVWSYGW